MKILINDALSPEAVELLAEHHEVDTREYDPEDLLVKIEEYDAILVRGRTKVTSEVIEAGRNLKVIGRAGIGVDNVDVAKASEKGIQVVNAPSGSTYSVAELTMGHIINMARSLPTADASMKAGKWEKKKFKGTELHGKTIGFIGLGRIGMEVAIRCRAFGMEIMAFDPYIARNCVDEICATMVDAPEELYSACDIISIHTPLTDETRHMVGAAAFEAMKDTAFIVNCARGGIVDEAALYEALKAGKIRAAALDSFEKEPLEGSPLLGLDNIFFTPHIGASTKEAQIKAGTIVGGQVLKVLAGEKPDFCVNPWCKQRSRDNL